MYTELMMKFEQFRENSDLYTTQERREILKDFKEQKSRLEGDNRKPTFI